MTDTTEDPGILQWTLGFVMVGMAWGFTNPFIRKAAMKYNPPKRDVLEDPNVNIVKKFILRQDIQFGDWMTDPVMAVFAAFDMLKRPSYAIPLLINLTGSVWFFLLIGKAELSLTVPIVNSLAFLFTVLGEWFAERKVIERETWIGMALVLAGIGLCVRSKT